MLSLTQSTEIHLNQLLPPYQLAYISDEMVHEHKPSRSAQSVLIDLLVNGASAWTEVFSSSKAPPWCQSLLLNDSPQLQQEFNSYLWLKFQSQQGILREQE